MDFRNQNGKSEKLKKGFAQFLERQGFYLVLLLCLGIVGVTAYFSLSGGSKQTPQAELAQEEGTAVGQSEDQRLASVTPMPTIAQAINPTPAPTVTPQATPPSESAKPATATAEKVNPPLDGKIIFDFADSSLLYSTTLKQWTTHMGVDIAAAEGTNVTAVLDGTVEKVEKDAWMGNKVTVKHSGNRVSVYANLLDDIPVKEKQSVKAGDVIGKVGKSALAECEDEPHLHFEFLLKDKRVNPAKYVKLPAPLPQSTKAAQE